MIFFEVSIVVLDRCCIGSVDLLYWISVVHSNGIVKVEFLADYRSNTLASRISTGNRVERVQRLRWTLGGDDTNMAFL